MERTGPNAQTSVRTIVISPGTDLEVRKEQRREGVVSTCVLRSKSISDLDRLLEEAMHNRRAAAALEEIESMPHLRGGSMYVEPKSGDNAIVFTGAESLDLLRSV